MSDAEDFDPAQLRVTELRAYLTARDIHIPKNLKKAQLVRLVRKSMRGPDASEITSESHDSNAESVDESSESSQVLDAATTTQVTNSSTNDSDNTDVASDTEIVTDAAGSSGSSSESSSENSSSTLSNQSSRDDSVKDAMDVDIEEIEDDVEEIDEDVVMDETPKDRDVLDVQIQDNLPESAKPDKTTSPDSTFHSGLLLSRTLIDAGIEPALFVSAELSSSASSSSSNRKRRREFDPDEGLASQKKPHTLADGVELILNLRQSFVGIDILPPQDSVEYKEIFVPSPEVHVAPATATPLLPPPLLITQHRRQIVPATTYSSYKPTSSPPTIPNAGDDEDLSESDECEEVKPHDKVPLQTPTSRSMLRNILHLLLKLSLAALLLVVAFLAMWYRQQQYAVGFCGAERQLEPTFADLPSPLLRHAGTYLDTHHRPQCMPCPAHALCQSNLEFTCFEDFVEYRPLSNFWRPHNAVCIPDTLKAEKLESMLAVALDLLHHKNAQVECGVLEDAHAAGLTHEQLHDMLLLMKAPYIPVQEFESLWQKALYELERNLLLSVQTTPGPSRQTHGDDDVAGPETETSPTQTLFRSTSLEHVDWRCSLRNNLVRMTWGLRYQALAIICAIALSHGGKKYWAKVQLERIKQELIVSEVLAKLHHQYVQVKSGREVRPYLGATQLRDTILGNEDNIQRRVLLWNKITKKVESNTNVAIQVLEVHGEVMKVWQWIGD